MSESVGRQAPTVSGEELGEDLSLFDSATGTAVALNGTARDIWALVDGEASFDDVVATLAQAYRVEPGDHRGRTCAWPSTGSSPKGFIVRRRPVTALRLRSANARVDLVGVDALPRSRHRRECADVMGQLEVGAPPRTVDGRAGPSGARDRPRRRPAPRPQPVCRTTRISPPRRSSPRSWTGRCWPATRCLTLHAAVVAGRRGGAAIVPAVSGAGKSTLAARLPAGRSAPCVRRGGVPRSRTGTSCGRTRGPSVSTPRSRELLGLPRPARTARPTGSVRPSPASARRGRTSRPSR